MAKYFKTFGALSLMAGASVAMAAVGQHPPDARQIMMRMADFVSKAPKWSVTLHTGYDVVQPDGYKVEWNDVRKVTLVRPDRLRVESERSDGTRTLLTFEGKGITTFDESAKVYAQASHPGSVDDAVVYFVRDLRMRLPLALLLVSRFPEELQQRVQSVEYVEKTMTLGAPADHIVGRTATVDFQLWIAVLTYKNARGQPQYRAQFSDWNFDIDPSDSLFTFTPPAGANKIPFVAALSKARTVWPRPATAKGGKQ